MEKIETSKGTFYMEQAIGGYYRLVDSDGNYIHSDSACEDVYNKDNARDFFLQLIETM